MLWLAAHTRALSVYGKLHSGYAVASHHIDCLVLGIPVSVFPRLSPRALPEFLQGIAICILPFLRIIPMPQNANPGHRGLHHLKHMEILFLHPYRIHTAAHSGILAIGLPAVLRRIRPAKSRSGAIHILSRRSADTVMKEFLIAFCSA